MLNPFFPFCVFPLQRRRSCPSRPRWSAWRSAPAPASSASPPRTRWTWCGGACRRRASRARRTPPSWGPCARSWRRRASCADSTRAWAWTGSKGPSPWGSASPRSTWRTASCSKCTRRDTSHTESGRAGETTRDPKKDEQTWCEGGGQLWRRGRPAARSCSLQTGGGWGGWGWGGA